MSAWICRDCTAAYAVDVPKCPQCGTNNPIKEDEQLRLEQEQGMPKIHVDRPPTIEGADDAATAEGVEETVEVPERPDANAKKADWVDYAVALGHDREGVESLTKAEIVELVDTNETIVEAETAVGSGEAS